VNVRLDINVPKQFTADGAVYLFLHNKILMMLGAIMTGRDVRRSHKFACRWIVFCVIFMKNFYLKELLEIYVLYFFNIGCYDWTVTTQSGAPAIKYSIIIIYIILYIT
jgi:hypothetical protein